MALTRLIASLVKRYCPLNARVFQVSVMAGTVLLLGIVLFLGWRSSIKVTEVVTDDFNKQQLVLARHMSMQIENSLNKLKREVSLLSLSPSVQYKESVFIGTRMSIALSSIVEEGGLEIRFVEGGRPKTHVVDGTGYQSVHPYPDDMECLAWARQGANRGKLLLGDVRPSVYKDSFMKLIMTMTVPVWQVSVDESHPRASREFSGALILLTDVTRLIERVAKGVHSGKTGYAWVIDENGIFLYHPKAEFIGGSAFKARMQKEPKISFVRINEIQKEMMLTGKEGMSWYVSGWHGGKEGKIKKLIAYSPVNFAWRPGRIWSTAVVAPASEVEGAIRSIQARQFTLQALVIVVILIGGMTIVSLVLSWSDSLDREVKRKTVELQKSEQRYRSLVENAEDIIFTVDREGNFLSINKYGAGFFGRPAEDIKGKNISAVVPWPGGETMLMTVEEVFEAKQGRQSTHPVRVGGREFWLNTNFRRLLDEEGNIYAVLGISRDITDRKKMEEQSYHTEKLASLGTLSAGVAHEINNPLAIILGFTDLLLERTPEGSEQYEMLKAIERQGQSAKGVVENLLGFARITEHKEEAMDINKNMESVLAVQGNNLLLNKIKTLRHLAEGLPTVKGDPRELQQVFFNMINNAVSSMKGGGTLTVSTRAVDEGRAVEIRFCDTGHGIKEEHRTRIFDPLFTTKKVGEGTGLGLYVSYGIIKKYGGEIAFETKTEEESAAGCGTTFIVTLPANDNAKETTQGGT